MIMAHPSKYRRSPLCLLAAAAQTSQRHLLAALLVGILQNVSAPTDHSHNTQGPYKVYTTRLSGGLHNQLKTSVEFP